MLNSEDAPTLLDVRRAPEHHAAPLIDAPYANVAHTTLSDRLSDVPRGEPLVVHCAGGVRSARAVSYLQRKGFRPINLKGGHAAWVKANRE